MPVVACGKREVVARLFPRGVGFGGTPEIAKSNAWLDAVRPLTDFMAREAARWRCARGCPGEVRWVQGNPSYGAPQRRADGTVRITGDFELKLVVTCPGKGLAMANFKPVWVGPFADKEDAVASQAAAVAPPGGGKTGFFILDEERAKAEGKTPGPYYILFLPGGGEEGGPAEDEGGEPIDVDALAAAAAELPEGDEPA